MNPANWICPVPLRSHPNIVMGHGGGGKLSAELVKHLFLPAFDNEALRGLGDAATVEGGARLAISTDSFVVRPLFFPGGNIGDLAVNGTVNDVAMVGAQPKYLAAGFILEEGLPLDELGAIVESMQEAADHAGVDLITGDTKVVDRGHGDGVFITTTGIGVVPVGLEIGPDRARPGDAILVSGTMGDHGMAIMSVREGLDFETTIASDTASLNHLVAALLGEGIDAHVLRDPTRGGLASSLNEIAHGSEVGVVIDESAVPVDRRVKAACELLGMDPFYVANEGKLVAMVPSWQADEALEVMRAFPVGQQAATIGEVVEEHPGMVVARTAMGTTRIVDTQIGEQLPRIC